MNQYGRTGIRRDDEERSSRCVLEEPYLVNLGITQAQAVDKILIDRIEHVKGTLMLATEALMFLGLTIKR